MTEARSDWFHACTLQASLWEPEFIANSDWAEFTPFAFWLVEALSPRRIVELGTREGQSFMAFGQAIDRIDPGCSLFGIGTWHGDGVISDEPLLHDLQEQSNRRYGQFSRLLQMAPADALTLIEDGSIDVLNVVGETSSDALTDQLRAWRPKLSDRAVALVQNTQIREPGEGVFHAWEELSARYPSFELPFAGGLGLLCIGTSAPSAAQVLVEVSEDQNRAEAIRSFYRRLGAGVANLRQLRKSQDDLAEQSRKIDLLSKERSELIAESHRLQAKVRETAATARAEADSSRRSRQQAQRELSEVRNSASWKVTKPLRAVGRARRTRRRSGASGGSTRSIESGDRGQRDRAPSVESARQKSADEWRNLFDSDWYSACYPDVLKSGSNPAEHFASNAAVELRDPNPWFNTAYFSNRQLLAGNENPLIEYRAIEQREHVKTSVWFDSPYYCRTHDVPSDMTPLEHFLARGQASADEFPMSLRSRRRKKVVLVSGEAHTVGHRYRIEDAADALSAADFDVRVTSTKEYPSLLHLVDTADVVWMWRVHQNARTREILNRARAAGAVLLGDIDDLVFLPEIVESQWVDGVRTLKLETVKMAKEYRARGEMLAAADMRVATTEFLVEVLEREMGPAVQLPNGYDADSWRVSQEALSNVVDDGLIRIGYAGGSLTHQKDLAVAIPGIARVLRENPNTRLVLFKGFVDYLEFPELVDRLDQIEWRDSVHLDWLPTEYARFSINIAPLEVGNPFCDAKSALKYYEAALVKVPTIASPTPPFVESINDGVNGILATSEDDWYRALTVLVGDAELRSRLALQAKQDVIWRFGPLRRSVLAATLIEAATTGDLEPYRELLAATNRTYPRFELANGDVAFERVSSSPGALTVLVWAHNSAETVEATLKSIAEQTEDDVELVVVDADSADSTVHTVLSWLREHDDGFGSVRLVRAPIGASKSSVLNAVFDQSRTPYVIAVSAGAELPNERAYELRTAAELLCAAAVNSPAADSTLLAVEGWAAVGGFRDVAEPVVDLGVRLAEFGLVTRELATPN